MGQLEHMLPPFLYATQVRARFQHRVSVDGDLSVSRLLLACMKAHNSQLYLLLLEPDQVGINGVLFVHATRIARGFCRDSVDLRRVVPRYGPHTWVRPHTHTHTPAGNQPALSSRLLPPASKFYSKQQ